MKSNNYLCMKNSLLSAIFLILFFPKSVISQSSTWSQTLNIDYLLPSQNNDSVSVGPIALGITSTKNILGLYQMTKGDRTDLVKTDSSGRIIWDVGIAQSGGIYIEYCFSFHVTNDDGCCFVFRHMGSGVTDVVQKRDSNGTVEWSKTYNGPTPTMNVISFQPTVTNTYLLQFFDSLVELDINGNFIRNRYPFTGNLTATTDSAILNIKTDTIKKEDFAGNPMWNVNVSGLFQIISVDSLYIFAQSNARVMKIGLQNGNVIWDLPIHAFYSAPTSDGGFITTFQDSVNNAEINKYDLNGNLEWTKTSLFPQFGFHAIKEIIPGSYIVGGGWRTWFFVYQQTGYSPFIARLDSNGNSVLDSTSYFYPGNANNNSVLGFADDAVYVAAAMGTSGPAHDSLVKGWTQNVVYSKNWTDRFQSGINYKFSDVDGNGQIDSTDLLPLLYHFYPRNLGPDWQRQQQSSPTLPDLRFEFRNNSIHAADTLVLDVIAGSSSVPFDSIYGLSFNTFIGPTLQGVHLNLTGSSLEVNTSSFGNPSTDLYSYFNFNPSNFNLNSVVICRTNHINAQVAGDTIATISMLVPPTYSGTDTFYLSVYSNAISWGGYQLQYNTLIDTIYISSPVGIIENHISSLSISPNPTSNELNISLSKNSVSEIMVVDLQGKEKIKLTTKESFTKLDVNSLMNGVYLLVVKNPDVVYQEKFVVIK